MKSGRQGTILRIISEQSIETQNQLMDELKKQLFAWKPWAVDLLAYYLAGKKKSCTAAMAKKYGVSEQVIRKYKRQFEKFVKNFFEGVSF